MYKIYIIIADFLLFQSPFFSHFYGISLSEKETGFIILSLIRLRQSKSSSCRYCIASFVFIFNSLIDLSFLSFFILVIVPRSLVAIVRI